MIKPAFPAGDDRGETLIETLISIVLLGILGLAVLDGTIVLSKSAALYDRQASAFKNQRAWAEDLSGNYPDPALRLDPDGCPSAPIPPKTFSDSLTDRGAMACLPMVTSSGATTGVLKMTITVTSTLGDKSFTTTPLDVLVVKQ
jgi:Tfp pilus assembly protein PilX